LEVEIRKMVIQGQHRQKVNKTPSQPVIVYGGICLTSQQMGSANMRITVQAGPGKKAGPYSKNTNQNKAGVCISSIAKKKKKSLSQARNGGIGQKCQHWGRKDTMASSRTAWSILLKPCLKENKNKSK
jgi:hypothetical protein